MTTGAVKGIDIIIKKKPSGHAKIAVVDGSIQITHLEGTPMDHRALMAIGEVVNGLLNLDPRSAQAQQAIFAVQNAVRAVQSKGISGR